MHRRIFRLIENISPHAEYMLNHYGNVYYEGVHYVHSDQLMLRFRDWLINECKYEIQPSKEVKIVVGGKNFATFDAEFFKRIESHGVRFHRRMLDPAQFFADPLDQLLPDLKLCCERAGIPFNPGNHHSAMYDAQLVVDLLRKGFTQLTWRQEERLIKNLDLDPDLNI